jgi:DNA (cytosine-5)-methyltransferase 1
MHERRQPNPESLLEPRELATISSISCFSGTGQLDRAAASALRRFGYDMRTVAYIEKEAFPQAILRARIADGLLDEAPIYGDICDFPARAYRGVVDCIVAGWPCQPSSVAGKRLGTKDERFLFHEIIRIADEAGAKLLFGENVPGLLLESGPGSEYGDYRDRLDDEGDDEYWERMLAVESGNLSVPMGDSAGRPVQPAPISAVARLMAESGFDAAWLNLSAASVGAPHGRERFWCVAWRQLADTDEGGGYDAAPHAQPALPGQ